MALLLGVHVLIDKSYSDLDLGLIAEADVLFIATGVLLTMLTAYHLPLTTYHLPLTTNYLPPTNYYLPLTTYHVLPTTY